MASDWYFVTNLFRHNICSDCKRTRSSVRQIKQRNDYICMSALNSCCLCLRKAKQQIMESLFCNYKVYKIHINQTSKQIDKTTKIKFLKHKKNYNYIKIYTMHAKTYTYTRWLNIYSESVCFLTNAIQVWRKFCCPLCLMMDEAKYLSSRLHQASLLSSSSDAKPAANIILCPNTVPIPDKKWYRNSEHCSWP